MRKAILWSLLAHVGFGMILLTLQTEPDRPGPEEPLELEVVLEKAEHAAPQAPDAPSDARPPNRVSRPKVVRASQGFSLDPGAEPEAVEVPAAPGTAEPPSRFESFGTPGKAAAPDRLALTQPDSPEDGSIFKHPVPSVIQNPPSRDLPRKMKSSTGLEVGVERDGTITFRNPPPISDVKVAGSRIGVTIGGKFDLTEAVMGAIGDDPYSYEKAKIAEATREERLCMAVEDRQRRKREAVFRLKGQLEVIAAAPGISDAEKRLRIFELWDDCQEGDGEEERRLAEAARATVIAFVRRTFPESTPRGYSTTELAMLNRGRKSSRRFEPYGLQNF